MTLVVIYFSSMARPDRVEELEHLTADSNVGILALSELKKKFNHTPQSLFTDERPSTFV